MFVLGTAGHIDHGKSSLIRAMTGIDPDRLPEEKKRGITIDLGFAWMKLPDGSEVGLVDVPGHERFVRNMVAGAGGINAAMLVIAADDGWMPQTQEHLDILNLLEIKHGFVALTKTDLVESDWVELMITDIAEKLAGTFLEGAPIIPCSAETKAGVDDIIQAISDISARIKAVEDVEKSRLFIDRSFVLTGIGVVVTGTSRGGGFSADSDAYHFPSGDKIRIRSLQSHERQVASVGAGTRVAINITGADREEISRGDVITGFAYPDPPTYFAVNVSNLANSNLMLKEGRKVLIIHGTTETEAILRPFPDAGIKPGEENLAIIKTEVPLCAFVNDSFILRLPTPQVTVGGGRILDILESYPRRKDLPGMSDYLRRRKAGELSGMIATEVEKRLFTDRSRLLLFSNFARPVIESAVAKLIENGSIIGFDNFIADAKAMSTLADNAKKTLEKTHKNKSYLRGLTADELMKRLKIDDANQFSMLMKYLQANKIIDRENQFLFLPGFTPELDGAMKSQADDIMRAVNKAGHNYLSFYDLDHLFKDYRKTLNFLRDDGRLVTIGTHFVMTTDIWKQIVNYLKKRFDAGDKITLAELRDEFNSTRKYALPLLEYLDQIKMTKRDGDYRIKGANFDELYSA
ncbi:MAG: selenocysteine-specific translation elongation factor [Candidatus Zixiibacteriota bacterium]